MATRAWRIGPMSERDVQGAFALVRRAYPPDQDKGVTESGLAEELTRPWARLWRAADADEIVGFLLFWHVADELHVLNVATDPMRRREGIANALLDELMSYARRSAIRTIVLEVRPSNVAAVALYRKHGFFVMGVRRGYYQNGEDALDMVLFLNEAGEIVPHEDEVRHDHQDKRG